MHGFTSHRDTANTSRLDRTNSKHVQLPNLRPNPSSYKFVVNLIHIHTAWRLKTSTRVEIAMHSSYHLLGLYHYDSPTLFRVRNEGLGLQCCTIIAVSNLHHRIIRLCTECHYCQQYVAADPHIQSFNAINGNHFARKWSILTIHPAFKHTWPPFWLHISSCALVCLLCYSCYRRTVT